MRSKIGTRLIDSLVPQIKPFQVHDTEVRGFILRVQPSGEMTYYFEYRRLDGRKNRVKLGKHGAINPFQARDRAKEVSSEVVRGIDPKEGAKLRVPTLKEFLEKNYDPWAATHLKAGATYSKRIRAAFKFLLDLPLDDPKLPWLVEKWKNQRLKDGTKKLTINRDLCTIKGALSFGVKNPEQSGINIHPLAGVKMLKVATDEGERVRYLNQVDQIEESRLFTALHKRETDAKSGRKSGNEWRKVRGYELYPDLESTPFVDSLRPIIELCLNTGLRRGELFKIRWDDITWNLDTPVLTIRGSISKNNRSRQIPLNDQAIKTLSEWKKSSVDTSGLIFPSKDGKPFITLKTAWGTLIKDAQMENFRVHDMRHTFASRLVIAGVDLNTVRELLGHSDLKMTLRYAHLSPSVKAEAVSRLVTANGTRSTDSLKPTTTLKFGEV
jgi:integrase